MEAIDKALSFIIEKGIYMYKILLVDDDVEIYHLIEDYNKKNKHGYQIDHLLSSKKLMDYLTNNVVDVILMDWKLKKENGLEIIKDLKSKEAFAHIPMILLTSKNDLQDQIQGLDGGADDYITKPVALKFLYSKMNAFLRKENKEKNTTANMRQKFLFDEDNLTVEYLGQVHQLTNKAFIILKTLVDSPLKVHSQEELNELTSGKGVFVSKRSVDTFITIIRNKIGKDCITSIRKRGYKLNEKYLQDDSAQKTEQAQATDLVKG